MKKNAPNAPKRVLFGWGEKIERWLIRFVALALVALVVAQALMTQDLARFYLSFAERLDGKSINSIEEKAQTTLGPEVNTPANGTLATHPTESGQGSITLELVETSSLPQARVLVNQKAVQTFQEKRVSIPVNSGDILEIDGTFCTQSFSVKVSQVSANVRYPKEQYVLAVDRALVRIGQVSITAKNH